MSDDVFLEILMSYGLLFLLGSVLSSLIPSLIIRWLMDRLFDEQVSFWLLVAVSALTLFLSMLAIAWLGLFEAIASETVPVGPSLLLIFAAYAFQIAMFTAFVTDQNLQIIAMWKWIVVLIAQAVVYFLISFTIGLAFGLILATV